MKSNKLIFLLLIISLTSLAIEANITGAFFQLNTGLINKPRSYWSHELDLMQQAGMDTIIIQYSANDSSRLFKSPDEQTYQFEGPFAAGKYELVIEKGPIIVYDIQTSAPFNYEISGSEPLMFFGDDGHKLADGINSILSAIVWDANATEPIIISIELEEPSPSISLLAGAIPDRQPLPEAKQVTLAKQPATMAPQDDYSYILEEAEKRNMQVWLGLKQSEGWTNDDLDLKKYCADNLKLAAELQKSYGTYPSFIGWYISEELCSSELLPENFKELTLELHKTGKSVSIAPYFQDKISTCKQDQYLENFIKEVPMDVLILQDGVGFQRPLEELPSYYQEVSNICQKYQVKFWSDLQVFEQVPATRFLADTADFNRVKKQIVTQAPYVDKIVVFDWPHYMNPAKSRNAKALYENYVEWLQEQSL